MRACICLGLWITLAVLPCQADEDKPADTPAAAKARKLLQTKMSVDFKDTRLEDAKDEIMEEVKGLKILLDAKGGVSRNRTITFKAKEASVEDIIEGICKKLGGLGYFVMSKKGNAYDGTVIIKVGDERGYEKAKK
ncbi:MAG: hypothetical protein ACKO23_11325 [Gemmataceae bacterium]